MNKRNVLQLIAACAAVTATTSIISACSEKGLSFSAIDLTGADYAKDFALTDHNGQSRSLKDFGGKIVMLFFGYIQCPDVCPTTLHELAQVKALLGKNGDHLQVLFVTVDPERDTPELLKTYMAAFDPSFLALYTSPEKLQVVAKDYKLYYKKVAGPTPTSYSVDHSAGTYVYDTHGKLRLYAPYGSTAQAMAADIELLQKGA
jgi:protein SCO1/2